MYNKLYPVLLASIAATFYPLYGVAYETAIIKDLASVGIIHNGQKITIMRNQNVMLDYLKRSSDGDQTILVIDSRTPHWVKNGTILV